MARRGGAPAPNALGDALTPSAVGLGDGGALLVGMAARERQPTHPDLTATALVFREAVLRPGHPLHRSWRELTKPATERSRRSFGVRGDGLRVLLNTVRTHCPASEQEFHWCRVAL